MSSFIGGKGQKKDFLIKNEKMVSIEVKSTPETRNLLNFIKSFNVKEGLLIHDGRKDEYLKTNDFKVKILPLFELAF
ncbi:MAG: hypothetical protein QXS21_02550 [Thermoproteota archaeon]|nr:hypothetical protein [Candidatus Brockarchaeota archaeon]